MKATDSSKDCTQSPIDRLRIFVQWAIKNDLCTSESDFERRAGLCNCYIRNNKNTGRGDVGSKMLARIVRAFPQLNLAWLCTGDGEILTTEAAKGQSVNADYKKAYEAAMIQVEALNKIITKLNRR